MNADLFGLEQQPPEHRAARVRQRPHRTGFIALRDWI
jgi:hypothetical protein